MGNGTVFRNLHSRNLLDKVFKHIVIGSLEGRSGEGNGVPLHLDGISPVRYLGSIKLAIVNGSGKHSQIDILIYDFEFFYQRLVAHKLCLEHIGARLQFSELYRSVLFGKSISDCFVLVACLGKCCRSKGQRGFVRSVFENSFYAVTLRESAGACEDNAYEENEKSQVQFHTSYLILSGFASRNFFHELDAETLDSGLVS